MLQWALAFFFFFLTFPNLNSEFGKLPICGELVVSRYALSQTILQIGYGCVIQLHQPATPVPTLNWALGARRSRHGREFILAVGGGTDEAPTWAFHGSSSSGEQLNQCSSLGCKGCKLRCFFSVKIAVGSVLA